MQHSLLEQNGSLRFLSIAVEISNALYNYLLAHYYQPLLFNNKLVHITV
ncbi:hypothetical protein PPBDW_I30224 [Photobacterium kishitanii]|nr:hypothetical protein PPBDW_I30224 [Photobacterium kishitanii]